MVPKLWAITKKNRKINCDFRAILISMSASQSTQMTRLLDKKNRRRRVVDDVRTYFQTTTERFFIPMLTLETAKIN